MSKDSIIENVQGIAHRVHEHGFVRVIDVMGDDAAIVQAARVSYGEGTKSAREDAALIDYLMRNDHTSPFEMCEIKLHVKMPIFIARQWVRHRTASMNEVSGRYSELPAEFYIPAESYVREQSRTNKQGRQDIATLEFEVVSNFRHFSLVENTDAFDRYKHNLESGIARELARIDLPLSTYTEFYWKIDLHNLLHFLKLRLDSHAQQEIRDYANVIWDIVKRWVPSTASAFENHVLRGKRLSGEQLDVLQILGEYLTEDQITDAIIKHKGVFADKRAANEVLHVLGFKDPFL